MNLELESMAIEMPAVVGHPNRQAFRGVLTLVDVPSTRPPSGARGHRVLLSRAAAEQALASLLGMGLDYTPSLDGHDARRKVGIITSAEVVNFSAADQRRSTQIKDERKISGNLRKSAAIEVQGYVFARDFPEVVRELRTNARGLGMSYEITGARVADMRAAVWVLTDVTFTGAAILRREKAAYRETWIELEETS